MVGSWEYLCTCTGWCRLVTFLLRGLIHVLRNGTDTLYDVSYVLLCLLFAVLLPLFAVVLWYEFTIREEQDSREL